MGRMIVPKSVNFSDVPRGGVFSSDLIAYFIKADDTTQVDLMSGNVMGSVAPATQVTFFPNAQLILS
jgi:hypothetical protein